MRVPEARRDAIDVDSHQARSGLGEQSRRHSRSPSRRDGIDGRTWLGVQLDVAAQSIRHSMERDGYGALVGGTGAVQGSSCLESSRMEDARCRFRRVRGR